MLLLIYILAAILAIIGLVVILFAAQLETSPPFLFIIGVIYIIAAIIAFVLVSWIPLVIGLVVGLLILIISK